MRYEQVKEQVMSVNSHLLSIGLSWDMIDDFWKECINDTKERLNAKSKA